MCYEEADNFSRYLIRAAGSHSMGKNGKEFTTFATLFLIFWVPGRYKKIPAEDGMASSAPRWRLRDAKCDKTVRNYVGTPSANR